MKDREDRYIIEWNTVNDTMGEVKYATITITELWSIGHLLFKHPLKLEVFFGKETEPPQDTDTALVVYDFGMDQRVPLEKNHNFLYDYAVENDAVEPIKTVLGTVKFDLMHAFFHYKGDPNYGHTHWALYGNLKDRVDADDNYLIDDWEKQNGIN